MIQHNSSDITSPPTPTFEVKFPDLLPERIPLRAVSDTLSAIQDIASGRDPFEMPQVDPEKSIRLLDVRRSSATYDCIAHAPVEAVRNLGRIGTLLSASDDSLDSDDLVAALSPLQSLSDISRSLGCRIEVRLSNNGREPLFTIGKEDYKRISKRILLKGETSVAGSVERVGGATGMRCLMRIPNRRKILYCDVASKALVRRLGQHLYENIVASGTATWIHRSWRIVKFTVKDFSQPRIGNPDKAIEALRNAGLKAWDYVADPEASIREPDR